jgi:hypothetical protein
LERLRATESNNTAFAAALKANPPSGTSQRPRWNIPTSQIDAGPVAALRKQLELLARRLDTEPEVPEGEGFKRFPGMTVCGEAEFIKTFLLPGQSPKDEALE